MPQDPTKQAKRLLETPEGRKVLGDLLGLQIGTREAKLNGIIGGQPIEPVVAVLVPCYNHPDPKMTNSYNDLLAYTREAGGVSVFAGPVCRGASIITWARNRLIKELLEGDKPWTHVLFWDDDIVPPPDALVKMLAHQKDVIVGLCTCRSDPPIPNIRYWRTDKQKYEEIISWEDGLIEIGAGGTGFMLISRRALNEVAEAYFTCQVEQDIYQMPVEAAKELGRKRRLFYTETKACMWFRCLPYVEGVGEMGEDVSFCHILRKYRGTKIYCDTTVQPDHVGTYEFGIKDFLPHRDAWIQEAKMDNRYVAKVEEPSRIIQLQ